MGSWQSNLRGRLAYGLGVSWMSVGWGMAKREWGLGSLLKLEGEKGGQHKLSAFLWY